MGTVYLIPSNLHEEGFHALPGYITTAIKDCRVFFVENERTTRRYFKQLWKTQREGESIVIDDYEWYTISEDPAIPAAFRKHLSAGTPVGIVSEAGCPGVADPGQGLVAIAQEMNATVRPLVGPSSVLLALMASGLNGQQFRFCGYLPVDAVQRQKAIRELETESAKKKMTQVFIETPYRNNQLLESLVKHCHPGTKICIAADLTGSKEWIKTKTARQWASEKPELHKRPVIFLLFSG